MNIEEIKSRVFSLIAFKLGVSAESLLPEANFVSDLGADSLDQQELVFDLEREFDFEIPEEDAAHFQTVGSVLAYLEEKLTK